MSKVLYSMFQCLWPPMFDTYTQGLRENFFHGVRRSMPGPHISSKNDRKKDQKKGLHRILVRFFAQNQMKTKKKRSSLKFSPLFCPKLDEDQKKTPKKLNAGT